MRLIKSAANGKVGTKEKGLIRLVRSFVVSLIAYVAAYHNCLQSERNKINAIIRRTSMAALGLFEGRSTIKLLSLGVHNTLDEIA